MHMGYPPRGNMMPPPQALPPKVPVKLTKEQKFPFVPPTDFQIRSDEKKIIFLGVSPRISH